MGKTETIIVIFILVVAFAGIWFLFKGPGLATQQVVERVEYEVQGRACLCNDPVNQREQAIPIGAGGSIYDCRNMCQSSGWQFTALRQ